jgi:serine/threonine-protein kinase
VVVDLHDAGQVSGIVRYPKLGCRGTWSQDSRSRTSVTLTESIAKGPCVTTTISLVPTGSVLRLTSTWKAHAVFATLHRIG